MRWQKLESSRHRQAPLVNTWMGHLVMGHGTCSAAASALAMPFASMFPRSLALHDMPC